MKASIKIVAGIGIVQAMIAPAKDKISESLILKSFQAIPGVGRLGQGAGEIMLGCAMLIKTVLVWRRLSCFFHCADPACKNTNLFADVQIAFRCAAAGFRQQDCGGHRSRCQGWKSVLYRDKRCIYIVFYSDCDSMCIYKLYGRLIGHEELFVSGVFFMVMTYLTPKEQYRRYFRFMLGVFLAVIILKPLAAGYEYDMRFAELTKKIEGISYEYDEDTTDLFTAFEAEEN